MLKIENEKIKVELIDNVLNLIIIDKNVQLHISNYVENGEASQSINSSQTEETDDDLEVKQALKTIDIIKKSLKSEASPNFGKGIAQVGFLTGVEVLDAPIFTTKETKETDLAVQNSESKMEIQVPDIVSKQLFTGGKPITTENFNDLNISESSSQSESPHKESGSEQPEQNPNKQE